MAEHAEVKVLKGQSMLYSSIDGTETAAYLDGSTQVGAAAARALELGKQAMEEGTAIEEID